MLLVRRWRGRYVSTGLIKDSGRSPQFSLVHVSFPVLDMESGIGALKLGLKKLKLGLENESDLQTNGSARSRGPKLERST